MGQRNFFKRWVSLKCHRLVPYRLVNGEGYGGKEERDNGTQINFHGKVEGLSPESEGTKLVFTGAEPK